MMHTWCHFRYGLASFSTSEASRYSCKKQIVEIYAKNIKLSFKSIFSKDDAGCEDFSRLCFQNFLAYSRKKKTCHTMHALLTTCIPVLITQEVCMVRKCALDCSWANFFTLAIRFTATAVCLTKKKHRSTLDDADSWAQAFTSAFHNFGVLLSHIWRYLRWFQARFKESIFT
jgi:hypothetical protein